MLLPALQNKVRVKVIFVIIKVPLIKTLVDIFPSNVTFSHGVKSPADIQNLFYLLLFNEF